MINTQIDLDLELDRIDAAYKLRKKLRGIEAYIPNVMQHKAHKSIAKTILYIGGNRAGKSTFGAAELSYAVTREYPDWFPIERRFSGPIKAVISATEFPIVTRVIEPKLLSLLPKDYYTIKRTAQGYIQRITCKDGSVIDILTSEMKDDAYESADWDIAWLDEPQSQRKYQAIRRGLVDREGLCMCTFTPLTEPWMKEELVDKADGRRIEVFTVDIMDNTKDIMGNPILKKESIQDFIDSLPEDVRETRVHGRFFHLRGAVYKEFSQVHIMSDMKYRNPDPVIAVLDPHDRNPHHVIWAFLDKQDDIYVDFEMIVHCELPDLAKKILAVEEERHYKMAKRIIDPNFGLRPAKPGVNITVSRELANNGAKFYDRVNDDIDLGHMVVRNYLHYDRTKELTAINKPKLYFSQHGCPITIRSIRNHQHPEWKGPAKTEKDPKEGQKEKESHGADCVRYLCITKPTFYSKLNRQYEELYENPY